MSEKLVGYFGFGSLVNRNTLRTNYVDSFPATLSGWRRHWQTSVVEVDRDIALLSIHRDTTCQLKGMMVVDHEDNLPAVDEREIGYDRIELSKSDVLLDDDRYLPNRLFVYVGQETGGERENGHLLQSYLDAVLQGYHLEYGEQGVGHFMQTTIGFERLMDFDRENPKYPRSVSLSDEEKSLIDLHLNQVIRGRL